MIEDTLKDILSTFVLGYPAGILFLTLLSGYPLEYTFGVSVATPGNIIGFALFGMVPLIAIRGLIAGIRSIDEWLYRKY